MRLKSSVITAALVAAALAAPAAHAADLRSPDARDADAHYGLYSNGVPQVQDLRSPDARDAADGIVPSAQSVPVVRVVDTAPGGFSWSDAGIGAAASLGLVLLVAGAFIGVSRRRLHTT
jgi:uncharacterized iron-regulated membrane protein